MAVCGSDVPLGGNATYNSSGVTSMRCTLEDPFAANTLLTWPMPLEKGKLLFFFGVFV